MTLNIWNLDFIILIKEDKFMFIREFTVYARAAEFAQKTFGTIVPQFDWDRNRNRIIKKWIVKY